MSRKISFIVTDDKRICAFADGKAFAPIAQDHPNYQAIKDAIVADDVVKLTELTNIPQAITNFAKGKVEIKDGVVFYSGQPLHNGMTDRILTLMREQFPFEPMLRFLENLMENPSMRAVEELYGFLAHRALPITDDGCFLGYKRVGDNWMDLYSGKINNAIGQSPEMPRNRVDDNRAVGCSKGLHVGSIEYVRTYGSGGHVVIVKVNPKDVVSVPSEDEEKLRCCKYLVIGEYDQDLIAPVYTSTGQPYSPPDWEDEEEDPDDDFDDEDFDDDSDDDNDDDDNDGDFGPANDLHSSVVTEPVVDFGLTMTSPTE